MSRGTAVLVAILGIVRPDSASGQVVGNLPGYVPLLAQVKAKALAVEPGKC